MDPSVLGVVNGVQGSTQTVFEIISYAFSIWLSNTDQFKYLVRWRCISFARHIAQASMSFGFVLLAAVTYIIYAMIVVPPAPLISSPNPTNDTAKETP